MKPHRFSHFIIYIIMGASMFSCQKEQDARVYALESELTVFATEAGSFFIALDKPIFSVWELGYRPDWMRFEQFSGIVSDDPVEIRFNINAQYYYGGTHYSYVEIKTLTAGKTRIDITLIVGQEPVIKVTPDSLAFSASENQKEITIANAGTKILEWELEPAAHWLVFSSESGTVDPGKNEIVTVAIDRSFMESGSQSVRQSILSNSLYPEVFIDFEIAIANEAIFSLSDEDIQFGFFDDEKMYYLKNTGNQPAGWELESTCDFISLSSTSGYLDVGDSAQIFINIDRSNLLTQTYHCELIVQNSNGSDGNFSVSIENYAENVIFLDGNIIDAKYNRTRDIMVFCTTGPDKLIKYNTLTESFSEVTINEQPIALSVSQDGTHAVVGYQNYFSYVDLVSMQVIQDYPVSIRINDLLLAPNNWVYITNYFSYEGNLGVNLDSGEEGLIASGPKSGQQGILLHPSGNYILTSDRISSAARVHLYDISSGELLYINSERSYGSGPVWLSDDWSKLFNNRGDVMFFSLDNEMELSYAGIIQHQAFAINIKVFDYHGSVNKLFTVGLRSTSKNQSFMRVYDNQFFQNIENIDFPMMIVPDGDGDADLFESEGVYGFFNQEGSKYHFLLRVQKGYPPVSYWAITTFDVN